MADDVYILLVKRNSILKNDIFMLGFSLS